MTILIRAVFFLLLSANAFSMEYRWGQIDETKGRTSSSAKEVIYLTGDIRFGDYDRFRTFLLRDFESYLMSIRSVYISSNGGDVVEAIKIGQLLREMYAEVYIPPDSTCASACFVLYVSAIERSSSGKVGIHRPYFDQRYFAGLGPMNAEKRHLELTKAFNDYLERNYVSRQLVDRMNGTSSKEIRWLTEEDLDELGKYANWYEEFLLAKCKLAPNFWEDIDLLLKNDKEYTEFNDCKEKVIQPELRVRLKQFLSRPIQSQKSR